MITEAARRKWEAARAKGTSRAARRAPATSGGTVGAVARDVERPRRRRDEHGRHGEQARGSRRRLADHRRRHLRRRRGGRVLHDGTRRGHDPRLPREDRRRRAARRVRTRRRRREQISRERSPSCIDAPHRRAALIVVSHDGSTRPRTHDAHDDLGVRAATRRTQEAATAARRARPEREPRLERERRSYFESSAGALRSIAS